MSPISKSKHQEKVNTNFESFMKSNKFVDKDKNKEFAIKNEKLNKSGRSQHKVNENASFKKYSNTFTKNISLSNLIKNVSLSNFKYNPNRLVNSYKNKNLIKK